MNLEKTNLQEKFLDNLKKKIDNKTGVDVCLWKLSYSYMIFKICYTDKTLINQKEILDYVNEQMESETFQKLQNLRFKKMIKIEHVDGENELHYIWEHRRDKTHPHGNVKIFCNFGIDFGNDDAGSVWSHFGFEDWKFYRWAEDKN